MKPLFLRLVFLSCVLPVSLSAQKIDKNAHHLAKRLGPAKITRTVGTGDLAAMKKQLIPILEILERTNRTSGTSPRNLLSKAYHFRNKDIGPHEALLTSANLLNVWENAHAVGLFNEKGKYTDLITKGRDAGEKPVMEYLVPAKSMPRFSTHLANVRLIEPSKARQSGPESSREAAYQLSLKELLDELDSRQQLAEVGRSEQFNEVGLTPTQAAKAWEEAKQAAGDNFEKMPVVNLEGRMMGSPSHMTKERWRIQAKVENQSRHATEIDMEWWIFGTTDKKNTHYIMSRGTKKLELISGVGKRIDLFSGTEASYKKRADDHDGLSKKERKRSNVRYRGFAILLKHPKGNVAIAASDKTLLRYIDSSLGGGIKQVMDFSNPETTKISKN